MHFAGCSEPAVGSQIECRIHIVHIFLIQLLQQQLHGLSKTLEVNNLPLPQEFDHIVYIRVIGQPKNVVIGDSGLLLRFVT